jgi:diketogulonate reductase-like aldo/keto reductase
LNKIEGAVVLAGIVDLLDKFIGQARQFASRVRVAMNQFAAFSILENLKPNRLVLAKTMRSGTLDPNDYRLHGQPKFSEANFDKNLTLVNAVQAIADARGVTVGQIALAWLHSKGPDVIPIPGTSTISHLDQNLDALKIDLTEPEIKQIEDIFHPENVVGDRYAHVALTFHGNKK